MTVAPPLSEAAFQQRVIDYAKRCGWMCVHHRPGRQGTRYVTAVQGDRGAPDLLLARAGTVLLVELKTDTGRLGPGQTEWLTAADTHARLWRPRDWNKIMEELR